MNKRYLDMCLLKIVGMGRRNINSREFVEKCRMQLVINQFYKRSGRYDDKLAYINKRT